MGFFKGLGVQGLLKGSWDLASEVRSRYFSDNLA